MRLNIRILISFHFFCIIKAYGQELSLSKKSLNNLLSKSVSEHSHYPNGSSRHEWVICGEDSLVSMLDTVRLKNNSDGVTEQNCYHYTTWEFCKRHCFRKYYRIYHGYATSTKCVADNLFHIKLKKANNELHLKVFKSGLLVNDFTVIKIEYYNYNGYNKYAIVTMLNRH